MFWFGNRKITEMFIKQILKCVLLLIISITYFFQMSRILKGLLCNQTIYRKMFKDQLLSPSLYIIPRFHAYVFHFIVHVCISFLSCNKTRCCYLRVHVMVISLNQSIKMAALLIYVVNWAFIWVTLHLTSKEPSQSSPQSDITCK